MNIPRSVMTASKDLASPDPLPPKNMKLPEKINQEVFDNLQREIDDLLEVPEEEGSRASPFYADEIAAIREACEKEGLTAPFIAKKIRALCAATSPKWNPGMREWEHFKDWPIIYRAVELLKKIHEGPEKASASQNVTINVGLLNILQDPRLTPDQQRAEMEKYLKSQKFITVEAISGGEELE